MLKSPSTRGRPKDPKRQEKARISLIQSASQALKNKHYAEISIREIAASANVNSAMISYHFGGKEGLFFAVIQQVIGEQQLDELHRIATDKSLSPKEKLRTWMTTFVSIHQNHPWLSRLIIDQVMMKKGKLRDLFIEYIITKNEAAIKQLITQLIADGYFRDDLNNEFTRTSLISLLAFPFICAPLLKQAFAFDVYQQDNNAWIDHSVTLFLEGCRKHDTN